jgi:predicted dehydrogenase
MPTLPKASIAVIGLGSIGRRHAEIATGLGCRVVTVSRRDGHGECASIESALATKIDSVVIATETSQHTDNLAEIASLGFRGRILVEKPSVAAVVELSRVRPSGAISVGYNLRFLPIIDALRSALREDGSSIIAAQFHVGQAFDTWRPGRDALTVYSAFRERGGGVLRDLSHELDLALWLFGPGRRVAAIGGRYTDQTVDSDDAWSILLSCERCPQVMLTLNGIDHAPRRTISVTTAAQTYHADLVAGILRTGAIERRFPVDRNETYRQMWAAFLSAIPNDNRLCSWEEGANVVHLIDAIEAAGAAHNWAEIAEVERGAP